MAHEGDAAEQVIRIALTGGEVALRLTGSLVKNVAAFLLAMRRNNKVVYGRKSVKGLLRNTRDLRMFDMSPGQFKAFKKLAGPLKILYAGVGSKGIDPPVVDVMLPTSEVERANMVFAAIGYTPDSGRPAMRQEQEPEQQAVKKKESRSPSNSKDTRDKSTSQSKGSSRTSEKPSVTAKLEAFDKIAKQQGAKPKARTRAKGR